MKGIEYKLKIFKNWLALSNSINGTVAEIFLPKDRIAFTKGYVIRTDEARYNGIEKIGS